ncbi:hypothetical protein [Glycomyces niveus]|uniref:Secreted protein n=1 Tax=Glycomyces niveus TaxID=2820287 RepID=A0ABS3U358_9ACTN|nr:hypothetical protein [Glycomyces sp. NEAU-S30]MBO3733212.1 hypothetical protein [Glycomyces sp. NEAU-S30]
MIRFIAKAAVAAAAAGVMAAGMAAPAIAAETTAPMGGYENHEVGGINLLSDLCVGSLSSDVGLIWDWSDITSPDVIAMTDVDSSCDSQSQILIDIEP